MELSKSSPFEWDPEMVEIERHYAERSEDLVPLLEAYALRRISDTVLSAAELYAITTPEVITFYVKEALTKYDPAKHANLAWYTYQRLRFLVGKWKRQQTGGHSGAAL